MPVYLSTGADHPSLSLIPQNQYLLSVSMALGIQLKTDGSTLAGQLSTFIIQKALLSSLPFAASGSDSEEK